MIKIQHILRARLFSLPTCSGSASSEFFEMPAMRFREMVVKNSGDARNKVPKGNKGVPEADV